MSNYQPVPTSGAHPDVPGAGYPLAVEWSDGLGGCFADCGVCCMGWWPLGCAQHLFATNVRAEGSEPYSSAFVKALGLTLVFPTLTSAIATTSATAAQAMSPLNTIAHCVFACYGMAHRQEMRRRFNIRGTDCCCDCCACACDGNSEKTDDFCVYLWCAACAICQEARHVRRYSLGIRARRGGGGGMRRVLYTGPHTTAFGVVNADP